MAGLRRALHERNPVAFADCFSDRGWVRVPHPDGDITFRGRDEIARAGYELWARFGELNWTPSQRFVAAGQVVEEAVGRMTPAAGVAWEPDGRQGDATIRVSMRVVTAADPIGGIGSLTLWIDWAALDDPLGVLSARGAASALVAQARARDGRGLRVIRGEPGPEVAARLPAGAAAAAIPERPAWPDRLAPPGAGLLWWRRHRGTLAGAVMAGLTVVVLGWVAYDVLQARPATTNRSAGSLSGAETGVAGSGASQSGRSGSDTSGSRPAGSGRANSGTGGLGAGGLGDIGGPGSAAGTVDAGTGSTAAAPKIAGSHLPAITTPEPSSRPTVQDGPRIVLQSDVLFETGSTRLSRSARIRLRQIAAGVLARDTVGTIQINGYTDDVGGTELNRSLSQARATSVAEALRSYLNGSDANLMPQGFGESSPVRSNATADGRQRNRRVTVVLPDQP